MNRFVAASIAMLVAGCASTPRQDATGSVQPIPMRNWQQLQAALQDAPVELRRAIKQTGEARLQASDQLASPSATESSEYRSTLLDILTHTDNQTLLPDAAFESLNNTVIGKNRQLRQSFAMALTGYLTQHDFGCQQPVFAKYFQRRYHAVQKAGSCADKIPFSVFSQYDGANIVWLNPKRVRSIHLLFASKSQSMASWFGHVALRLVVCPGDNATEADCDANLFEHVVLGFQAHIDDLSLDTLKALDGKYGAYLFANQFIDVYRQYAIDEFREVYSLPLRLDETQRELMLRELADIHWRYTGEYNFFTRNCASLLQNALRITWPEFNADARMASDYLRPDSLFEAIKASPFAHGDKLASLQVAEREGYYFSSTRQFYDRAIRDVRAAMKRPEFSALEDYMRIHPVLRRQSRSEDKHFSARLSTDPQLREAQMMLEEHAIFHSERVLMIEGAKYFEQQDFLAKTDNIRAQLDTEHFEAFDNCLLTPIRQHTNPIRRLDGIPNGSEIANAPSQPSICRSAQGKKVLQEAIAGIKDAESRQWQRLNELSQYWAESITNLHLLKEM